MNRKKGTLVFLLFVNVGMLLLHIFENCVPPYLSYFSQLTILGQSLVIVNFVLAINHFHQHKYPKLDSRLYIINFSIETVAVLGFWALRIFFSEGIIHPGEKRTLYVEALSLWVHGGSYLTLLYIGRGGKVQLEFGFRKKLLLHLCWALTYIGLQWYHFTALQTHIYPFLALFNWNILIAFEASLYVLSILSDYFLTFAIEHKQHAIEEQAERRKEH